MLYQARAFLQAAASLAPHMYEPHYNHGLLSHKVRVAFVKWNLSKHNIQKGSFLLGLSSLRISWTRHGEARLFFLRSQMELIIAVNMLLKLVSCWVSRGTGEKIENGGHCFYHANVLCLARQPREGASPLTCRSHETPGGELARTLHTCLRETFHVVRCLIIMWYRIRSWLLVNHVISHAFPIATKSWYHTRTEILTPLDLTHSALEILPKNAFWSFTTKPFTGHTLRGLLIQMQNISLQSSGMRRKQNFELWGLKVT